MTAVDMIVGALIADIERDMGAAFTEEQLAKVATAATSALQQAIEVECEDIRERIEQIVVRR